MAEFDPFAGEHQFAGGIVGKEIPDGKQPATIHVTTRGLEAETADEDRYRATWDKVSLYGWLGWQAALLPRERRPFVLQRR